MLTWLENIDWVDFWSWTTLVNIIDIIIVAFFIYQLIKIAQGTRATELLKGILVIITIKFLSSFFQLHTTEYIVDFVIQDRKSTRLNSSHVSISYAVFCL